MPHRLRALSTIAPRASGRGSCRRARSGPATGTRRVRAGGPRALLAASIVAAAAIGSPAARASAIACPGTLTQSAQPERLPAGWELRSTPGELPLQRVTFYDGDPAGMGTHAPESTRRVGSTETSVYAFSGDESPSAWIGCLYRDATAVVAQRLPAHVRRCTTTTRLSALGDPLAPLSVDCR
jgi:hypothetical protein